MPQLAPRVLKDAATANQTYDVATSVGNKQTFVNHAKARFSEQSVLVEQTRATTIANDGHKFDSSLKLPHPVTDQVGCCVDKDTPPSSYVNTNVLASKFATSAQLDDLIALYRSYVASAAFAELVKGGSNW